MEEESKLKNLRQIVTKTVIAKGKKRTESKVNAEAAKQSDEYSGLLGYQSYASSKKVW